MDKLADSIVIFCSAREEPKFKVIPQMDNDAAAADVYNPKNPKAPYFTRNPSHGMVKEGHPVRFECTLMPVGDPNLNVEWYRNGELVKVGE